MLRWRVRRYSDEEKKWKNGAQWRMSIKDAIIRTTSKSRAPSLGDEAFGKYDNREDEDEDSQKKKGRDETEIRFVASPTKKK